MKFNRRRLFGAGAALGALAGLDTVAVDVVHAQTSQRKQFGVWWPSGGRLNIWYNEVGVDFAIVPTDLASSGYLPLIRGTGRKVYTTYNASYAATPEIIGWWNPPDEPDAAAGSRTGPFPPATYAQTATATRAADPKRPVIGTLGRSMANPDYGGRGPDTGYIAPLTRYCEALDKVFVFHYPGSAPPVSTDAKFTPSNFQAPRIAVERAQALSCGKPVYFIFEAADIYGYRTPTRREVLYTVASVLPYCEGVVAFAQKVRPTYVGSWGLDNPTMKATLIEVARLVHG